MISFYLFIHLFIVDCKDETQSMLGELYYHVTSSTLFMFLVWLFNLKAL